MSLANWRDLAVVLLAVEAFVVALVPGVILYIMVRGLMWLIRKLRVWMPQVRGYFLKAHDIARKVSDKIAAPLIATNAARARVSGTIAAMSSLLKKREV